MLRGFFTYLRKAVELLTNWTLKHGWMASLRKAIRLPTAWTLEHGWMAKLLAAYLFLCGVSVTLINIVVFAAAKSFRTELLPAYLTNTIFYNSRVIDFAAVILAAAVALGGAWITQDSPRLRARLIHFRWPLSLPMGIISLVLASEVHGTSSKLFFAVAGGIYLCLAPWPEKTSNAQIGKTADRLWKVGALTLPAALFLVGLVAWYPVVIPSDYYELQETVQFPPEWIKPGMPPIEMSRADFVKYDLASRAAIKNLLAGKRLSAGQAINLRENYPDQFAAYLEANGIPGDTETSAVCRINRPSSVRFCRYLEEEASSITNSDEINIDSLMSDGTASPSYFSLLIEAKNWRTVDVASGREIPLQCAPQPNRLPTCNWPSNSLKPQDLDNLISSFHNVTYWNVQPGRTLFHHSYLFVPAAHVVRYGLDTAVPFLYGYGNTLVHAGLLMLTAPTLDAYFNTFPVGQALGFVALFLLVLYATGSIIGASSSTILSIAFFYLVSAPTIFLAPGLSPLRYLGLCAQIASIFFIFRGSSPTRVWILPVVFIFSLFWNREFSILGATGQVLALAAPSLRGHYLSRILSGITTLVLVAAGLSMKINPDFMVNVEAGFYGVGVPQISQGQSIDLALFTAISAFVLILFAFSMPSRERDARLAVIPIIATLAIKFIFNAAPPHFYYTAVAAVPFMACYLPWGRTNETMNCDPRRTVAEHIILSLCAFFCLASAIRYDLERLQFNKNIVGPLKQHTWAVLGDPIKTGMPAEPLAEKIQALKSEMAPHQKVLLLSPFDHLLSFYAAPETYCGQFELMTNIVSYRDIGKLVSCIKRNPNTLIVYDAANEINCPAKRLSFYDNNGCRGRALMKQALGAVWKTLIPAAESIKTKGTLSFMRIDPSKIGSVTVVEAYKAMDDKVLFEELTWKDTQR